MGDANGKPCDERRKARPWDKVVRIGVILAMIVSAVSLLNSVVAAENRRVTDEMDLKNFKEMQSLVIKGVEDKLELRLKPMERDVGEIKSDLKRLLRRGE